MRFTIHCFLLLSLLQAIEIRCQSNEFRIKLIDQVSNEPVSDAHLFIENTTFGSVSDKQGIVLLYIPAGLSEDLIVSHVAYETKVIKHTFLKNNNQETIIELAPHALEIEALTISAKRSKTWNKQYKTFRKAFLGNDELAKKCTIINPEVLRFDENKNKLTASAIDLIRIDNPHLGYEIHYLLNKLEIINDGSSKYHGQALFIDKTNNNNRDQIDKNRLEAFLNSPKYFFKSIIENKLEERGYHVEMMEYEDGRFKSLKAFDRDSLLDGPSSRGKYTLEFDEFLKVYNEKSRIISFDARGVRQGGLESQRFSTATRDNKEIVSYDFSYIYKISPYIILNQFGNVLNSTDIKEYGSWANQKVAHQLPFDFGNDYNLIEHHDHPSDLGTGPLTSEEKYGLLISLIYERDISKRDLIFTQINNQWENGYAPPLIEILRISNDQELLKRINQILSEKFNIGDYQSYYDWIQWLWSKQFQLVEYYFNFKSELYKHIDPMFDKYFRDRHDKALIRLDEVLWGGVHQDGIPPLRNPEMIESSDADYLNDKDIVFGVFINGIARAYPKRILAWHEFFTDNFKDYKIAGVYCTLCGTMIAYDMTYEGVFHDLGTSGFLYRSNKLMYDKSTQSLWSTIDGIPVIGSLVGKKLSLQTYPVVTTTWKSWRTIHPDTKVLSLNTGYTRDYSEGTAYKVYFATDELMFPVPKLNNNLKNKDEVLVIKMKGFRNDPLAISIKYLRKAKWHQSTINNQSILAFADKSGAARVYEAGENTFKDYKNGQLIDHHGVKWEIHEDYIYAPNGDKMKRLPAHNIFWFAWFNAYPNTRLVY